jgi:hypothetical protein
MPDGTYLGGDLSSNLFATFNASWPAVVWQGQILLAAQTWAQYTNLNLAVVPDDGAPFSAGAYEQGDPGEGDIRIGGFEFGNQDLAGAWFPPPVNDFSAAGDVFFNTAQPFNIGSTYDLYTVALHEIGHALGMLGSWDYYAAMYETYIGAKSGLSLDDSAGIRSLYSANAPRTPDGFGYYTSSFQTAADLTGAFDPVSQTLVGTYLDITYPGQAEYYRFLAPPGTSSQLTVTIQTTGLSLLSSEVILYDAYQQPLAVAASGYGQFGATISVSAGGVVPGELFWLRVSGVDLSPFGTGRYALIVNFGAGPSPTVYSANTATLDGSPIVVGGGDPDGGGIGQPDDQGFNFFEVKPEGVGPAQSAPAPQPPHDGSGSGSAPVSAAVELFRAAREQPSVLTASWAPPVLLVASEAVHTPPAPLLEPRIAQPASMRLESGAGNHALPKRELPEEAISLTKAVASLPDPRTTNARVASHFAPAAKWRAACTACFGEVGTAVRQQGAAAEDGQGVRADAPAGLNSTAALAGLLLLLGSSAHTQPEEKRGWK